MYHELTLFCFGNTVAQKVAAPDWHIPLKNLQSTNILPSCKLNARKCLLYLKSHLIIINFNLVVASSFFVESCPSFFEHAKKNLGHGKKVQKAALTLR